MNFRIIFFVKNNIEIRVIRRLIIKFQSFSDDWPTSVFTGLRKGFYTSHFLTFQTKAAGSAGPGVADPSEAVRGHQEELHHRVLLYGTGDDGGEHPDALGEHDARPREPGPGQHLSDLPEDQVRRRGRTHLQLLQRQVLCQVWRKGCPEIQQGTCQQ